MTKQEYLTILEKAKMKMSLTFDRVCDYSGDISPLDSNLFLSNVAHYKNNYIEEIKRIEKMSETDFARLNTEKLYREIKMRLKSVELAYNALVTTPYYKPSESSPFNDSSISKSYIAKAEKGWDAAIKRQTEREKKEIERQKLEEEYGLNNI